MSETYRLCWYMQTPTQWSHLNSYCGVNIRSLNQHKNNTRKKYYVYIPSGEESVCSPYPSLQKQEMRNRNNINPTVIFLAHISPLWWGNLILSMIQVVINIVLEEDVRCSCHVIVRVQLRNVEWSAQCKHCDPVLITIIQNWKKCS